MFKKASKIAVSFCLLVGAYAGYTRLFAIVTYQLGEDRKDVGVPFPEPDSKSARRAAELARESFPAGHWAASKGLKLTYYDAVHGLYLYAQEKEILKDGKQIHVWPFAMIWISKDGRSRKTVTSDQAWIDLSQPFMQVKPSTEASKIVHARLEGDVRLRDDKATLADLTDDLRVGPLASVEFDDATLQVTTEPDADIHLEDRNLTLTGLGMMIQLRRKPPSADTSPGAGGPPGFDAETAFVYKDVHIVVNNVTSDGVLPGAARPEKSGGTPIDVRSDREMRIDLPRPRPPLVGPPNPDRVPDPTLVKFRTNVWVVQGTDKADRLECDTLDLILLPDPRPVASIEASGPIEDGEALVAAKSPSANVEPAAASRANDGPLTELKIRRAHARGHAVWLQSEAQGMDARCVELIYEKHAFEGRPDFTYLNGGPGKKLKVEKVDYDTKAPVPGTIRSITKLIALDATIFDSGKEGPSKVIARGPGTTQERPSRNASVTREVWFEDEMELLTWRDGQPSKLNPSPLAVRSLEWSKKDREIVPPSAGSLRRLLTLSGASKLVDHGTATTLDSRRSIVAEFRSEPNVFPAKGDGPAQIKWLDAYEDAHLTAPSKILTARHFLKARFETPPAPPKPAEPALGVGVGNAQPVVVAAAATDLVAPEPAKPEPGPAKVEPLVDGRADRVWASIFLGPTGSGDPKGPKGELKYAQLRGGVMVHQDPEPGKTFGSDASGEALDLNAQGKGLMKFVVKREEPQAFDPKTKLASASKGRPAVALPMAMVSQDGYTIESEDVIGVDQKANFAWSQGAGVFIQMADNGLLDDKGLGFERPRAGAQAAGPVPRDKLAIQWTEEMRFHGFSTDLEGRPAAKVEFRGSSKEVRTADGRVEFRRGVEAKMTDSAIYTDTMDVYMDRTIAFNKGAPKPATPGDPEDSKPQIAMLDCIGKDIVKDGSVKHPGVDIINQKLLPKTGELDQKQRIQGLHVIYDKRTGNFYAPGPGLAWLYRRKGGETNPLAAPIPTAFPVSSPANANGRTRPEVVLAAKPLPPIELTKIKFFEGMRGRFGVGRDKADNERREAEFVGSVQTVNATVAQKNSDIEFDHLDRWKDAVFLSSDVLNVFTYPATVGGKTTNTQLLNARGNGVALANSDQIQADRITYNSASGLAYAYGEDGKEVAYTKAEALGQRPNTARGKTFRYNKFTRESGFDDPQAISFTDLRSGLRAKAFFPDLGGTPKPIDPAKLPRVPLQRQGRNATERNGFTGH